MSKQVSDFLSVAYDGLSRNSGRPELPDQVREILAETAVKIGEIAHLVSDLEKLEPLPVTSSLLDRSDFSALPLEMSLRRSALLQCLVKSGVRIDSLGWFTERDTVLAGQIAGAYPVISHHLAAILGAVPRGDAKSFRTSDPKGLRSFITLLTDHGVIAVEAVMQQAGNGDPDAFVTVPAGARLEPGREHMVVFRIRDPELYMLVLGDWVTCNLWRLVESTLGRRYVPFEAFTKITHSDSHRILGSSAEIEMIALFGQTVFSFDVALGPLTRDGASEMIAKSAGLKSALDRFLGSPFRFRAFALYDEASNSAATVDDLFTGSIVEPRRFGQISALIERERRAA